MINKRLINTGVEAAAAFDPLQNFETVTYTGNFGTQKITGYIRKGAAFNGSSSKIVLTGIKTNGSPLTVTDFSVSMWINLADVTSNQILLGNISGDTYQIGWSLSINSGTIRLLTDPTGALPWQMYKIYNSTLSTNTWYHIALVSDGTANRLYINGTEITSVTYNIGSQSQLYSNSNDLELSLGGSSSYVNGKIDQVRIFDKALSSSEVTTLYGETYASSTKSTTDIFGDGSGVALYELDEDANSSNFEQAAVFNGSSSYITINSTSTTPFDASAENFTISAWINVSTFQNDATIISKWGASDSVQSYQLGFQGSGNNTKLVLYEKDGSSNVVHNSSTVLTAGQWYHIGLVRNSTQVIFYINGSAETKSATNSINDGGSQSIIIGRQDGYSSTSFNGKIDQVRIYDTALSSGDVTNLYNESSVPTANLVAHYKLDGDATDETGSYNGTETSITYSTGVYGGTPTNVNFLGMAFQPDLVWIKNRDTTEHHILIDVIRQNDTGKFLSSNLTNAPFNTTQPTFDSNGFTLDGVYNGYLNITNNDYVAWCWKAGGTAVSNTDGSITSQVSANQAAGFSIVKYTGNSTSNSTFGHGLSQTPEMFIIKNISNTGHWTVWHKDLNTNYGLYLSTTNSQFDSTNYFWSQQPTSTTISIMTDVYVNASNNDYVAYCFHSVDGYQKVGSYSGSNSNLQVTTGFQPRFVLLKNKDAATPWAMFDNLRSGNLYANDYAAESDTASNYISFNSTGFELVGGTGSYINIAGYTWIYLAIA